MTNYHLIASTARAHAADLAREGVAAQQLRAQLPGLRRRLAAAAHALADRLDATSAARPETAAA